jgi:hypothetical protein
MYVHPPTHMEACAHGVKPQVTAAFEIWHKVWWTNTDEIFYGSNQYLLTYSMQQSPSWEANQFAASQEIPRILMNPKVHYRIHKCPPPFSILSSIQSIPPHPTSWRSILILSSHLCLGHPRFPHQNPVHASPLPFPHPSYMLQVAVNTDSIVTKLFFFTNMAGNVHIMLQSGTSA